MKNQAFDLSAFVQVANEKLTTYLEDSYAGTSKVLHQAPASELAQSMQLNHWIQKGGLSPDAFASLLDIYLANTQHLHHPAYIGHQVAVPHPLSGVTGLINGIANNPMGIYEMGPAAATIERVVVNWMLDKIGWFKGTDWSDMSKIEGNGGGILTHGGSVANLTAMSAARAAIAPEAWDEGTPKDLVILVPEVAHYSIARSISIMGMGKKAAISIPVDADERLRPESLLPIYERVLSEGKRVMAVIANACATSTGLYDPLDEVGHFCETNHLWYHVDGAHGAAALISPTERHLMRGAKRANSMIWDAHKMLQVPALCAAVLYKDYQSLSQPFQQKGSYLFHDKDQPGFDLMPYTVECTKSSLGTKLFWVLAAEGEQKMGDFVSHQYQLTRTFYELLNAHTDFYCPYIPEANILCFQYIKYGRTNAFQLAIRNEIIKRGHFYITSSEVQNVRFLRLTVMNALTNVTHIRHLIEEISAVAEELNNGNKKYS